MEGRHKAALELGLLFLLVTVGLALRHPPILLLAVPVAVHLTFGLALAYEKRHPRLSATRVLSGQRLHEGDEVEVTVEVENQGVDLEVVEVREPLPPRWELKAGRLASVKPLPRGGRMVLSYRARVSRGLYPLSHVEVTVRDLLGYTLWRGELPCAEPLAVLPRYERLSGLSISPRRTLVAQGTVRARRAGAGLEFFGTREYLPGDDVRRINWKAYARWDRLVITEFEEERATEVMVVLDVRASAYPPKHGKELLDRAARAAASLCQHFLGEGHRVGLLLYGRYLDFILPGFGKRHGERLLRMLARAELGHTEVFSELSQLPTRFFPPGSQIALVSPLVPGDQGFIGRLVARGYSLFLVIPDPLSLERAELPHSKETELAARILELERWEMLRTLCSAGVRFLLWDTSFPLAVQVRRLRRGRWL